ncbi:uncharacterized protein LOC134841747 [Symsagittifera roscoffensis]|uniref:uncharacterized protein LOC134841747 n=1 Tax=Symsagittifera roscoffensis TaxID=84072 RepID=UPI00307B2EE9
MIPELFELLDERKDLQTVETPRHYFGYSYDNIALHVFSDASYSALAAVAYFVNSKSATRQICSAFVLGKARVAPLKQHTIAKLELQAAVFGARLAKFIRREQRLVVNSTHMWTDSTTALQWIQGSDKPQQIFVHRVAEISESTQASQWNLCPGPLNPADDGTRGIPLSEFSNKSRWFTGPKFICELECNWPKLQLIDANTDTLQLNDQTGQMDELATTPMLAFQASTEKTEQCFIDYRRFSKCSRNLRTTAYVIRAARIFKDIGLQSRNKSPTTELTSNNMIAAKNFIFKQTQRDSFKSEVNALTQNKRINTNSRLRHLSPFLDEDGLLRARGRLKKSQLDYCIKHPIILDGNHPALHLFIGQTHKDNQHSPRQHLKKILQNEY